MDVQRETVGLWKNRALEQFVVKNRHGISLTFLNAGCAITKIQAPDRYGKLENIVLGLEEAASYLKHRLYLGTVCGRVAGRVKGASYTWKGQKYELTANDGPNQLHGGTESFDQQLWDATVIRGEEEAGVSFHYRSPAGENGYPGVLDVTVTYVLNENNEFTVTYDAVSDEDTPVNLTNHSYFNLSGNGKRTIENHVLKMNADRFLELGQDLVPTGHQALVNGTPFDFRTGNRLGNGFSCEHEQIALVGGGYDHPFLLSEQPALLTLTDPESGRVLEIETEEPCVVVYTANQLSGKVILREGKARKHLGVCLETQLPPDSLHLEGFKEACILAKDDRYQRKTVYRFLTDRDDRKDG